MRSLIAAILILFASAAHAQTIKIEGPGPNWEWHQTDARHGNVVVIVVVSRYTQKESYFVSWKLGTRLRDGDFRMFTVIDFIGIPRFGFIYDIARKRILKETSQSNQELAKHGVSPVEYICDMKETLRDKLDADPRHRVDVIVLDKDGKLRGHFDGGKEIDRAIKLIDELTER